MTTDCKDRWHRRGLRGFAAPYIVYQGQTLSGGLIHEGYECRSCGLRTARILDEEDRDITDQFITHRWTPTLLTRVREELDRWRDNRRRIRVEKGPCRDCGQVKRAAGWGDTDYICEDCMAKLLGPLGPLGDA